jgi:arylsulfatase A-like enzyme
MEIEAIRFHDSGLFQKNGYRTALFGKWHLGDNYPYRPQDRGFEEVLSFNGSMIPVIANKQGDGYFNPHLLENGAWKKIEGYITDIFFDRSFAWMKERKENNEPFFLYLPTPTPHVPDIVDKEYSEPYEKKSHNGLSAPAKFYGMIANIDKNMERLEAFLIENDLKENTILLFLSDNGTQSKTASKIWNAGMRGKKVEVFDGGHRVPLFIRWPNGKLRHGEVIDELVTVQDILPTLISLCGLKGIDSEFDGISIAGPLRDPKETIPVRTIVNQCVIVWRSIVGEPWDSTVVMRHPWRLMFRQKKELFNIESDPGQTKNVVAQHPEIVEQLEAEYKRWYDEAIVHHQRIQWLEAGGEAPNPTEFTAIDWIGTCSDTWYHAQKQKDSKGFYNIKINESGTYTITMRHWPEGSKSRLPQHLKHARLQVLPPRPGKFDPENTNPPVFDEVIALAGNNKAVFKVQLPEGQFEFAPDFLDSDQSFAKSAIRLEVKRDD